MKNNLFLLLFFACISTSTYSQENNTKQFANYIHLLSDSVSLSGKTTDLLEQEGLLTLPMGVAKTVAGKKYIICIDSSRYTPNGATFSAYMSAELPFSTEKLAFAAKNISFTPGGITAGANNKLFLVSMHNIKISQYVTMFLLPSDNNYVEWDCNGFKSVHLKGNFLINKELITPANSSDTVVAASFEIQAYDFNNLITGVSISPFKIKGVNDLSFTVSDAFVDMSSLQNPMGFVLPEGYPDSYGTVNASHWKGFFVRNFQIILPDEMNKGLQKSSIFGTNLIIDSKGVSGIVGATNLITLQEGNMNGWNFSIENISLKLRCNQINGGAIAGKIMMPFSKTGNGVQYSASVFQNFATKNVDYSFTLSPTGNISAEVFSSTITLYPNSQVSITKLNGRLLPQANLNGKLTVNNNQLKVPELEFQNLQIASTKPYLRGGVFALSSSISSNFEKYNLSINRVLLVVSDSPEIGFEVAVAISEESTQSFSASTLLSLKAKIIEQNYEGRTRTSWDFDKIAVSGLSISANTEAFSVTGNVQWFDNDVVYGKGFFGSVSFSIKELLPTPASVSGGFGIKDDGGADYKYWFVDAKIPVMIPIGTTGLSIYRLIGGLSYHVSPAKTGNEMKALLTNMNANNAGAQLYIPNASAGLSFRAGATIGTSADDKAFNADVVLEINFNTTWGINTVSLNGEAFAMVKIANRDNKPVSSLPVYGNLSMTYDFPNKTFHANLTATVNQSPTMTASGTIVAHFEPTLWYVKIGTPSAPLQATTMGIPIQAYFMVGKELEPMAAPPTLITNAFSADLFTKRNNTDLLGAKGFVFGARLDKSFSRSITVKGFGGGIAAGACIGFDAMIMNYGDNAHCSNDGSAAGFKGWYCTGQAYAGVTASAYIVVSDNSYNLFSGTAAVYMLAKMPNPYYFSGNLVFDYDILAGTIKGNYEGSLEVGQNCSIAM